MNQGQREHSDFCGFLWGCFWCKGLYNQFYMYDFDHSLHIGMAKSNGIGWSQGNDEASQDASQQNKIR